jgi:hypothetical protein
MGRTILVAVIAFVLGVGAGIGGYALLRDDPGSGVYCYNPDPLDPLTQKCIPTGR